MAKGPVPKQQRSRDRDNHKVQERLARPDRVEPPVLPKTYRMPDADGESVAVRWLAETKTWWEMWVESPQADVFLDSDWQRLLQTARIVDQFHRNAHPNLLKEIRLNEERLGATAADRLRLRWEVSDPTVSKKATSKPESTDDELAARRERVSKAV